MLPSCGHTLCEECGLKLLKNGQLSCPFDRTVNNLENGSIQTLPKNFAILELLENSSAPSPVPANPNAPPVRNSRPPSPTAEDNSVEDHERRIPEISRDDVLDDDIDPVLIQEMFGSQPSSGIPEPEVEDSEEEDDDIPVEEYMYNLQLEDNEDSEQVAEEPEDALDDDIDPVLLQEMFDPQHPRGIHDPEEDVEDSEDDEISVEEYLYNLGLDGNDDDDEDSENSDDDDDSDEEWKYEDS